MPTNHGSIEFLKFPDPQHPGDRTHMIKKWLRDSWARRNIVRLNGKFATVSVTLGSTNNFSSSVNFPNGFTESNCVILSLQVPETSGNRVGDGIFTTSGMRLFAETNSSGVRVYNNTSRYYGAVVKVTLMRIDV